MYRHHGRDIIVLAHVGDFMCLGSDKDLRWMFAALRQEYSLKMEMLSTELCDRQEVKFLNRTIKIGDFGLTVEGDDKHSSILINEWDMTHANGVDTPLTNDLVNQSDNRPLMCSLEAKRYRRAVARINFMAQDRCDLSSAVKVMSQSMAAPREGYEGLVKRVIRYIKRYPRSFHEMKYQEFGGNLEIVIDSDWAGELTSRRSTSGGVILHGVHMITHGRKLQATVPRSIGEA